MMRSSINNNNNVKEIQGHLQLELSKKAIEDLQRSGLDIEIIKEAKIVQASQFELKKYKIHWFDKKRREKRFEPLYIIPYLMTYTDENKFCRVKVIPNSDFDGKYTQPPKQVLRDSCHLYILPSELEKLKSPRCKLAIVEGEKKTLKLIQEIRKLEEQGLIDFKVAVIGISGINNWQTAPEWKMLNMAGREIILFFDADSEHNKRVVEAELELAGFLYSKGAGVVKSAVWSVNEGKGIDDFLVNAGEQQLYKLKGLLGGLVSVFEKYKGRFQDKELLRAFFKYPVRSDSVRLEFLTGIVKDETSVKKRTIESIIKIMRIELEEELQMKQKEKIKQTFGKEYINVPKNYLWEEGYLKTSKGEIITKFFIVKERVINQNNEQTGIILKFIDGKELFLKTEELNKRTLTFIFNKNLIAMDEKTAVKVLEYITQYLNINYIEIKKIILQTGWHKEDFYIPQVKTDFIFDDELNNEFNQNGNKEAELDLMRYLIEKNSHLALGYIFGFASTLIAPLNTQNFTLFGQGETGRGKTTTFIIGLSLFGYYENLKRNMNTTETGIELYLDKRKDTLYLLDELNTSNKDTVKQLVKIIYDFENAKGRTRANKNLTVRNTATYRGILAISSENSLNNLLSQGDKTVKGALRRVVIIDYSEFDELDKDTTDLVYETIENHYGNLIKDWIEYVKNNKGEIKKIYRNWIFELRKEDRGFRFNGQEMHLAVLFATCELIGKVFNIDTGNLFGYLWQIAEYNHFEFADATEITRDRLISKIEDFINENYSNFFLYELSGSPNKLFGVIMKEITYFTSLGLKELAKYIQIPDRELKKKLVEFGLADKGDTRIMKKTTIKLNKHISVYKINLT